MVVKIKKKTEIMGEETEITQYLPDDVPLTRERRAQADLLDTELKEKVNKVNKEYDSLNDSIKKDELNKWRWLGSKIDIILKSSKNIDPVDVDKHAIWPALGQYFRPELKRGFDARRSGTNKDHYRKCLLIATLSATDWFNSWSGWDAFIDRGEQLVMSKKIIPKLKDKFSDLETKLKPKDYQKIAKMLTDKIPSGTSGPVDIDAMSSEELDKIIDSIYKNFKKSNLNEK